MAYGTTLPHELPRLARTSLPCQGRPLNCNTHRDSCWQGLRKGISTETAGTFFKDMVSACFMLSPGDLCPSYRQISFCLCWPERPEWLAVVQQRGFFLSSLLKLWKIPALLNLFSKTVTTVNHFNPSHKSILFRLTETGDYIFFSGKAISCE